MKAPSQSYSWKLVDETVHLCRWAEPTEMDLITRGRPSPDAKIRVVRIVPEGRYRELLKAERELADLKP